MTQTNEQIQALKADLENAGGLEWLRMCADLEYCKSNPGHWLMSLHKTNFLAKMAMMSIDMLAGREADKKQLAEAQALATQQGNIACELFDEVTRLRRNADDKAPELRTQLEEADARIAELEARTLTVKFPARHNNAGFVTDGIRNNTIAECQAALIEACAAAGITLVVGGEDATN